MAERRNQIPDGVVGSQQTEINSEGEDELNEARARLAELQDGAPKNVSENQAYEVQVLGKLYEKMSDISCGRLHHDRTRKYRSPCKEQESAHFHIALCFHFAENVGVKHSQRQIEEDGQNRIGIIIVVEVLNGTLAILAEDFIAHQLDYQNTTHV